MSSRWIPAALITTGAGCGTSTPPGEAAPGLRAQLSRIDTALAAQQYTTARTALDALVRETVTARNAGTLSADQAQPILAAAARLAADLPSTPRPTTTRSPQPTSAPSRDDNGEKMARRTKAGTVTRMTTAPTKDTATESPIRVGRAPKPASCNWDK